MLDRFYFNPANYAYDFGPQHPLRPERLARTLKLLEHYAGPGYLNAEPCTEDDLLLVHSPEYVDGVRAVDEAAQNGQLGDDEILELRSLYGFWGDNPPFAGMFQAASVYTGASAAAARDVRDGARLAFAIGGGLHHALRSKASGFCIFNDCAVACAILRERFERVAYVDIDVHQGDGVQWIFLDDPTVLSCSIHEDGRTLWPGTGGVDEVGAGDSNMNVPMEAGTTADVWIEAFRRTIIPQLKQWKPEAIVLQMGTDTHYLDPLAHINSNQQAWLEAVKEIQALELPIVALGGGGYNLTTVPRMWASACLTLGGIPFEDTIPAELAYILQKRPLGVDLSGPRESAQAATFSDVDDPCGRGQGRDHAERVIRHYGLG